MNQGPQTTNTKNEVEKKLFSWKSPSRTFKKRSKESWVKLLSVVSLLGFIFFIAEGIMPVILLISVLFLFYVLSSVEPENIEYSITNKGINISDKKNPWEFFRSFLFLDRNSTSYLVLNMNVLPGRIEMIVDKKDIEKIKAVLLKYIPVDDTPQGRMDKATEWISKNLS